MLYSKLFGKTTKTIAEEKIISAQLLQQAGFISESTSGRYYFLPLGMRVQQKIIKIIKEEMDAAGGQEMVTPIFHPLSLWQETNRDKSAKYELTLLTDRRGAEFVPGGTAEEMFVDLIRKYQISYKDLPINIYQFSNKFRDEMRSRGGLLRVREFIMKDAYSFHANEEDFKKEYQKMWETYVKIFNRLDLKTAVVEADNGYIGGDYCHEFDVESDVGESRFLTSEDGNYTAHEDVAKFKKYTETEHEEPKPLKDVEGKGMIGVEALAKYLQIPVEKTTKTILFETETGEVIAAVINGLYDINEIKLKHIVGCNELKLALPETVIRVTGAQVGYAGILNLPDDVKIIMDESVQGRTNFEMGANKTDYHTININFGRDIKEPEQFYDIAMAEACYTAPDGKQKLVEKRGIEVGNIFQLGYHYSNKMKRATFTDASGQVKKYYMGCYGIGVGRTLATIVEKHHDKYGIIWPAQVAPYLVHLIGLDLQDSEIKERVEKLYQKLL
ncbi:MAG: proline--tRNA ligase, partial [bacterium]|nr:proline--tRNA ligase [bacterium]